MRKGYEFVVETLDGDFCAGAFSMNRSKALSEAQHYALIYGQDHPVRIREVKKRKAAKR